MNKDKLPKMIKYVDELKLKLSSSLPVKHTARESAYKTFLNTELKKAEKVLNDMKLTIGDKK